MNVTVPQLEVVGQMRSVSMSPAEAPSVIAMKKVGEVFEFDATAGRLVLKTTAAEPPLPRGLGPGGPLNTKSLREAIQATGDDVLAGRVPAA